jgi:hypothetical protein
MEKFQLLEFLAISGIGSASGIVHQDNIVYIISDNSTFLYQFDIATNELIKIALAEKSQVNILKINKPDFESITIKDNQLHIFGSGSTQNRNQEIVFDINTKEIKKHDLTKLYTKLKNSQNITDEDLNIEGALFYKNDLYLFQRGNGANSKNGVAIIDQNQNISFKSIPLPKIKHVETSFTDAVLVDETIYFLATAEDTTSTYHDGEILGSIIGSMNANTFEIDFTQQITNTHKFEGLTLYNSTKSEIIFLLCEDNDTEALKTNIYKLILKKTDN